MIKFPNPSFHKYSFPKNYGLRLNSLNPLLFSQEYILYEDHREYTRYFNENLIRPSK